MKEELLVQHCSPTLAGMKTGNMFSCSYASFNELKEELRRINSILVKKGLRIIPLKYNGSKALLYVFRPERLGCDLKNSTACRLLKERGYCCKSPDRCVAHLIRRLDESEEFPHEIGLFLGYPPEDVDGFIENKANGYKIVGCWKVYGNENEAKKLFDKFNKCTRVYREQWKKGRSLDRLTVSA